MYDLPSLRASGATGELRVAYQRAASLVDWRLTLLHRVPRTYRCEARLSSTHAYWFGQPPYALVLDLGLTEWTWPNVTPSMTADGQLLVDLTDRPTVTARRKER